MRQAQSTNQDIGPRLRCGWLSCRDCCILMVELPSSQHATVCCALDVIHAAMPVWPFGRPSPPLPGRSLPWICFKIPLACYDFFAIRTGLPRYAARRKSHRADPAMSLVMFYPGGNDSSICSQVLLMVPTWASPAKLRATSNQRACSSGSADVHWSILMFEACFRFHSCPARAVSTRGANPSRLQHSATVGRLWLRCSAQ